MSTSPPPLLEVRIVGMPLDVYREASEHSDELLREFALIRERDADNGPAVPARLLRLIDELSVQYADFTRGQERQLREAVAQGEPAIDLVYHVPYDVKEACLRLAALLDEADEFCRDGRELLTLATPPRALALRRWFLEEFIRQVDGIPPRPWAAWLSESRSEGATG